jgi:hypothetical protein
VRRFFVLGLALLAAGCGGHGGTTAARGPFRLGAFEPPLRVLGPLPGTPAAVPTPPEIVHRSARRLLVSGNRPPMRLPLYLARTRDHRLCIGTTARWQCLHPVDAQPVFAFTLQGGNLATRDWGGIVGIAAPDVRVTVEHVFEREVPLPLKRFPHFGWAAFASPMWRNGAPGALHFYDRAGSELSGFLDLAGGPDAPKRKWHVVSSTFDTSALDEYAKRIALEDSLVRKLLAGRRYSFESAMAWSKCSGGTIGEILSIHIAPATFEEDWPFADYDAKSHTAYVQHVEYFKVSQVTELDVSVDTNEGRVVGIDPTNAAPNAPEPNVNEFSAHPVDGGKPGGGPDTGDCSSSGD